MNDHASRAQQSRAIGAISLKSESSEQTPVSVCGHNMAGMGDGADTKPAGEAEIRGRAAIEATRSIRSSQPKKRWRPPARGGSLSDAQAAFMFVLLAGGCGLMIEAGGIAPAPPAPTATFAGTVARIVDGETFEMTGAPGRIRLWGLDAPAKNAPGGPQAADALKDLAAGQKVACAQIEVGGEGRILARCTLSSGEDIAALMIEHGAARENIRHSRGYYVRRGIRPGDADPGLAALSR